MWSIFRCWRRKKISPEERAGIAFVNSEIRHLRDVLASGSKMREQTQEERAANPTTFGYAKFPLTDAERKHLMFRIELFEMCIGINAEQMSPRDLFEKYFPGLADQYKTEGDIPEHLTSS